ncbi:dephospho-CoA kinase [Mesobacillus zeae]|uniref:Dephospho-CoA kinase n=1 Tax=Mesobacillus zeae TaxID=1917180 RepID=A0A398B006_9BACI|nr:dephospho-CoA kinase [Mesobacillus zeae]RID83177.1 dephospho-CoA kinase [Mesobacillus zeae]
MTLIIGLTGGIASGKSTVSWMLSERGLPIIDADVEARLAVQKGEKAYREIINEFGSSILDSAGEIDRAKLGGIIFNDEDKRRLLNGIVHPEVRKRMMEKRDESVLRGEQAVILDIPLLFESKLEYMVDKIILVFVNEETQLRRLMARNSLTETEAMARIQSQMPLKDKINLADRIIDNNGTTEETGRQLQHILSQWGLEGT